MCLHCTSGRRPGTVVTVNCQSRGFPRWKQRPSGRAEGVPNHIFWSAAVSLDLGEKMGAAELSQAHRKEMRRRKNDVIPDRSRPGSPKTVRPIGSPQDGRDKCATGVKNIKL